LTANARHAGGQLVFLTNGVGRPYRIPR
jgi:hypothetical protein